MREYRCAVGGNLLCKIEGFEGQVEIVNKRNRIINYVGPSRKCQNIGPKGKDFQQFSREMHCSGCSRLLGRVLGDKMNIEVKCFNCKTLNTYNTGDMYKSVFKTIPARSRENLEKQMNKLIKG